MAIEYFYDSEYESFFCYVDYPTLSNIITYFARAFRILFNDWRKVLKEIHLKSPKKESEQKAMKNEKIL